MEYSKTISKISFFSNEKHYLLIPQRRFAAHCNDQLDEFATEFQVFRQLQEVEKLIAFLSGFRS